VRVSLISPYLKLATFTLSLVISAIFAARNDGIADFILRVLGILLVIGVAVRNAKPAVDSTTLKLMSNWSEGDQDAESE
jgi:hypothetical protein